MTKLLKMLLIRYSGWGVILLSLLVVSFLLVRGYLRVGELERDNLVKEIKVSLENGAGFRFALNQETAKPEILSSDNYPLLNISDRDSTLTIDERSYSLWDLIYNYSVDR